MTSTQIRQPAAPTSRINHEKAVNDDNFSYKEDPFSPSSIFCVDSGLSEFSENAVTGGGYSDVWTGYFNGKLVAIKVPRRFNSLGVSLTKEKLFRRFWREYRVWASLSHPNILPFLGYSITFSQTALCEVPALISPWMRNGTLSHYLEWNGDQIDKLFMLLQIANGLEYIHQSNIVHGDIRAGNILVSEDGTPCITDFGLSRLLKKSGLTTSSDVVGSLRWMAPELLQNQKVTNASDVWAFGMMMIEVISGRLPFYGISNPAVVVELMSGKIPSKPSELTESVWMVCHDCWVHDPTSRVSISKVVNRLSLMHIHERSDRDTDQIFNTRYSQVQSDVSTYYYSNVRERSSGAEGQFKEVSSHIDHVGSSYTAQPDLKWLPPYPHMLPFPTVTYELRPYAFTQAAEQHLQYVLSQIKRLILPDSMKKVWRCQLCTKTTKTIMQAKDHVYTTHLRNTVPSRIQCNFW
ncbi:hypothetical protein M422DRAFT_778154 [Sphaerobolus stellatus SS14]|nr:hypothetical protein M422DRAFT_778154 [Sphaerobolus stellatus SS14]